MRTRTTPCGGDVTEVSATKDHDGADKVRTYAESVARPIREQLRAEQAKSSLLQARAASAVRIANRGAWERVGAAMASANASWEAWKQLDQSAVQACDKVLNWETSDTVRDGIEAAGKHARPRDQRYKALTQALERAAAYLYEVERDTNESDILSAQRTADEVASEIAALQGEQGSEPRARTIVEKWPRANEQFRTAMTTLVSMKKFQFHVDRARDVCQDQESQLLERVRRLIDAEPFDQNRRTLMASADAASRAVLEYYQGALVEAVRACSDLEKGTRNPPVAKVLSGDCDRGDLDVLHELQVQACSVSGKCSQFSKREDCDDIAKHIAINESCMLRRRVIMDRCFKGGDAPHRNQLLTVEKIQGVCFERQERLCR